MSTLGLSGLSRSVDPRRRALLQAGVAGSALLLAGRWLPAARAAEQSAPQSMSFTYLAPADVVMLGRVIPVMLEGALPQDPAERMSAMGEIMYGIDVVIHYQSSAVRGEIADLFGLLTKSVTRALVAGIWASWEQATDEDIRGFLAGWRNSRFALLRSAYLGLNNLIVGSWYGNPRSWARIGYGGPPKIA